MNFLNLTHISTYHEMLWKLAVYLFLEAYIATRLLKETPWFDRADQFVSKAIPVDAITGLADYLNAFHVEGLAIAALVSLIAYAAKLHDKLSDLFRIRHRFDIDNIIL